MIQLSIIEKMGEMLCDTVDFIKKEFHVSNPVFDKIDEVCHAVLPDLENLSSENAIQLANSAYDALKKIQAALSSAKSSGK